MSDRKKIVKGIIIGAIIIAGTTAGTFLVIEIIDFLNTPLNSLYTTGLRLTSAKDFRKLNIPGAGTHDDPYRIENRILENYDFGIHLSATGDYVIIENCTFDSLSIGILIYDSFANHITICNNTFKGFYSGPAGDGGKGIYAAETTEMRIYENSFSNLEEGIEIRMSTKCIIEKNEQNNVTNGILIDDSAEFEARDNNIYLAHMGIVILGGEKGIIDGNYIESTHVSLEIEGLMESKISNNYCVGLNNTEVQDKGIFLSGSTKDNTIEFNLIKNTFYGIHSYSNNCTFRYNTVENCTSYGMYMSLIGIDDSNENIIYHNIFINNSLGEASQGYDIGTDNKWYNIGLLEGNYWSNWDGIGWYGIDGTANSYDLYPLNQPI